MSFTSFRHSQSQCVHQKIEMPNSQQKCTVTKSSTVSQQCVYVSSRIFFYGTSTGTVYECGASAERIAAASEDGLPLYCYVVRRMFACLLV